jgi:hypothetical protein
MTDPHSARGVKGPTPLDVAGPERFELSAFGFGGRCPDPCLEIPGVGPKEFSPRRSLGYGPSLASLQEVGYYPWPFSGVLGESRKVGATA